MTTAGPRAKSDGTGEHVNSVTDGQGDRELSGSQDLRDSGGIGYPLDCPSFLTSFVE